MIFFVFLHCDGGTSSACHGRVCVVGAVMTIYIYIYKSYIYIYREPYQKKNQQKEGAFLLHFRSLSLSCSSLLPSAEIQHLHWKRRLKGSQAHDSKRFSLPPPRRPTNWHATAKNRGGREKRVVFSAVLGGEWGGGAAGSVDDGHKVNSNNEFKKNDGI